jgi:hypothetical protein
MAAAMCWSLLTLRLNFLFNRKLQLGWAWVFTQFPSQYDGVAVGKGLEYHRESSAVLSRYLDTTLCELIIIGSEIRFH